MGASLVDRKEEILSPWVTLITRSVKFSAPENPQIYHSLGQADYVNIIAVTTDGRIPVVRQFRPAMNRVTLEFPGGLLDKGENPAVSAKRELLEETGCLVGKNFKLLGCLSPDTGRLENKLWCYLATSVKPAAKGWTPESNVKPELMSLSAFQRSVRSGEFDHALNLATLSLAMIQGKFSFSRGRKS